MLYKIQRLDFALRSTICQAELEQSNYEGICYLDSALLSNVVFWANSMNYKQTTSSKTLISAVLFFLGFLEFGAAAALILQINPDPKNAIFFGYSLSRLALFLLASTLALWLLTLVRLVTYRAAVMQKLESVFQKRPLFWMIIIFSLALLSLVVLIIPIDMLGKYGLYFERARPLLFFLCLFPAQISLNWIKNNWHLDRSFLRMILVSLSVLLVLGGFIFFSKLGLTPEQEHWNLGGNPVTSLQLIFILFVGALIFGLPGLFAQNGKHLDLLIMVILFVAAVLFWQEAPVPHNEFSTRPAAPYFQSFPASDAYVHDLGALTVMKGAGIRTFTDKPLYMIFLAILHVFAGYDYNLLYFLHTCFLALIIPFLYILGKSFHSRLFGFVLASIVLIRQQNAILLSNVFNFNALPTQLMTEVPMLLGMVVASCALYYWMRMPEKHPWHAFVTGGILGAASLVRLNPVLLILATPVFLFLELRKRKKEWLFQSISFALGCVILIVPWGVTGTNQLGQSFFILKFQDIIRVRYAPSGVLPPEKDFALSLIPPLSTLEKPVSASYLPSISAGPSFPPIDIHTFPGFVINHTLHNFVGSFLTLPDSLWPDDQKLAILVERPYWSLGIEQLSPTQIPFILLNLCLLATGLAWSWKHWKWAGFSPLFVFVVYSLSLGLGRTSGSRYLVPIDWVVDFYFALGLLCLFALLPQSLRQALEAEPEDALVSQSATKRPSWRLVGAIVLIFCIAALVPAAQTLIPPQKSLCQPVDLNELKLNPPLKSAVQTNYLVYGEVLYPEINNDRLSFTLLTCQRGISLDISGFNGKLDVGQRIIAGLSDNGPYPHLELIVLPPGTAKSGQILWQIGSK